MDGQPLGSNFTYEYIKTTFYISFYQRQLAREAGGFFSIMIPGGNLGQIGWGGISFTKKIISIILKNFNVVINKQLDICFVSYHL